MSLVKAAQYTDLDGVSLPVEESLDVSLSDDEKKDDGTITLMVGDEEPAEKEVVVFELPLLPGSDVEELEPVHVEVEEEEPVEVEHDPFRWDVKNFIPWLKDMANKFPKHDGKTLSGLEKALAHGEFLLTEIPKATRKDLRNELDVNELEDIRDKLFDSVERLKQRHMQIADAKSSKYQTKRKKKADEEEDGLVKEAQKAGSFTVAVPLFISAICRTLINSTVSAGHDMEQSFKKLDKKYKFTPQQKLEIVQLLDDMGYHMMIDRGLVEEDCDTNSSDNFDFSANYSA